ncbi:MAG: hypothetical protein ACLGHQ_05100 [Acidimicrobiia bacterium]
MRGRRAHTIGSISVAVAVAASLSGCRADAPVAGILATEDPQVLNVIVDTCNADLDVTVTESADEVVVKVRNNDRRLFVTDGDDCQDGVPVQLAAPLGDRRLVLEDGREITLTTFPPQPDEPELDLAPARWEIDPDAQLDSSSTEVPILVQEIECASGQPADDRIVASADHGPDEVVLAVGVGRLPGAQDCPENAVTPYVVELDEPLGDRTITGERPISD